MPSQEHAAVANVQKADHVLSAAGEAWFVSAPSAERACAVVPRSEPWWVLSVVYLGLSAR